MYFQQDKKNTGAILWFVFRRIWAVIVFCFIIHDILKMIIPVMIFLLVTKIVPIQL